MILLLLILKPSLSFFTNCFILFCYLQDVLSKAKLDGHSRLDLFYYQVALRADMSAKDRKRLLERCVHVNPSEQVFWSALKEFEKNIN